MPLAKLKPTPQLDALAEACNAGAVNVGALLRSLGKSMDELDFSEVRRHPAIPCVLGQVASLLCRTPETSFSASGPTFEALDAWRAYVEQRDAAAAAEETALLCTPRAELLAA